MPRIARVVLPYYPHHITQRGNNRIDIFRDNQDRQIFLGYLKETSRKTSTLLYAYCLMTNHFHLLAIPESESGLGRCLHLLSFKYAQHFNYKYKRSGRLWQNRYFSCPVDREGYLWAVTRYIEKNPVRAKIVPEAEGWKWSSAPAHLKGVVDEVLSPPDWLGPEDRNEYKRFFDGSGHEEDIRKCTATGRPLGNIDFFVKIKETLNRDLILKPAGRHRKELID